MYKLLLIYETLKNYSLIFMQLN